MAPKWPKRSISKAIILVDAYANHFLMPGKSSQIGTKMGAEIDLVLKALKSEKVM